MKRDPKKREFEPQPDPTPGPLPALGAARLGWPDSLSPGQLRDRAVADLARWLNLPADDTAVRILERVDWPDAGLGCPEPGFMYAQVITPGHRIILEAGDRSYAYHASLHGVKLCPSGSHAPGQGWDADKI